MQSLAERVFEFPPFGPLADGVTSGLNTVPIVAQSDTRMRLVALRGGLANSDTLPLTGLETAGLELEISIQGYDEHLTNLSDFVEFAGLFTEQVPWFYFQAPPPVMHRDALFARIRSRVGTGATLTPYLQALIVDDGVWRELYT